MEKSGVITLTKEDLDLFYKGEVSERVEELWNLTFEELQSRITSHNYELI